MQILHCHAAGQRNKFSHVNYVFGLFRSATQFQIYNCIFIGIQLRPGRGVLQCRFILFSCKLTLK